ncbi:hypothetical protein BH23CHL2_BH23CHL2_28630 [soil metagenome]
MIWLVVALVVTFAVTQSLVIERLWRDQRRTRSELDAVSDQAEALAVAVERQLLTQDQIDERIKPVAAAIRESNQVVVETMDALVSTVREAKAERRKLRDLIATASAGRQDSNDDQDVTIPSQPQPVNVSAGESPAGPISWPETASGIDITAPARNPGRSRSDLALAGRRERPVQARKRATG